MIWCQLGRDTYQQWKTFFEQSKNINELFLSCKMFGQLLDDMYLRIEEAEAEHAAKAKLKAKAKVQDVSPSRLPRSKTVASPSTVTACPPPQRKKTVRDSPVTPS